MNSLVLGDDGKRSRTRFQGARVVSLHVNFGLAECESRCDLVMVLQSLVMVIQTEHASVH